MNSEVVNEKSRYRVPSMREIENVPDNGYRLVSTFSGCGGSCLGFRIEGFRTLWASEFVDSAREVYELNHPGVFVDSRDVREITVEDIRSVIGRGDIDILEGSPPCASFSTAGKRETHWGQKKKYSERVQRTDDLFFEFARLLGGLRPRAFVAENVSGLVKGTAKGYFKLIMRELKSKGYRVRAKVLDAQWLGVPQTRQRLIFIGFREDLGVEPSFPSPLPYRYSVRDAIDLCGNFDVAVGRNRISKSPDEPSPTILTHGRLHTHSERGIVRREEEANCSIEGYAIGKEWDRLGPGEQSDKYFNLIKPDPEKPSPCVTQKGGDVTAASVVHPKEKRKFTIAELKRICAFPDDFVLTGTYAQQWERLGRAVPPIMMAAVARSVRDILRKVDE